MSALICLTYNGAAQSQGSKRIGKNPATGKPLLLDNNPETRLWRHGLTALMRSQAPEQPWDGACAVGLTIYVRRPRSHFGSGRNAGVLKPTAPRLPPSGKDADKVARAVGDAGNGVLWTDDARITDWRIRRRYTEAGEPERVELTLWQDAWEARQL